MFEERGYIVVLTGDGKGKTTSALGMAMRAVGQGLKVAVLQFLKGSWTYGELDSSNKLAPYLTIKPLGEGFIHVDPENPDPNDIQCVENAWEVCKEALFSGDYDMVILDEINNAIAYGLLPVDDVLTVLQHRPITIHVVMTGRGAHPRIIEFADLVTEMIEVKHPFRSGMEARKGIEF